MIEIERIQTLQYMGSKSRMLSSICEPIISNDNTATVVDLFAGTGSVGYALSPYKKIISNDLEYYAYILNEAILNGCTFSSKERSSFKKKVIEKYNQTSKVIAEALKEEERLLQSDLEHYMEYAKFSEETPSVFNPRTKRAELKELEKLVSLVEPGKKEQKVSFPCLFLTYYANAYFGIKQCCQIDVMVSLINEIDDVRKRNVLFSALMSALSACASTTTHFAQFLKVKSKGTFKNIKEKRSQDIYQLFDEALTRFEAKGLLDRKERLSDTDHFILLTHNKHFYLNVKYGRDYKKDRFIRFQSAGSKTHFVIIDKENDDYKTSYESLWNELKLLFGMETVSADLLLNPIRRIIETYTKFNAINKGNFCSTVDGAMKLFNVNSHSIDDVEAELNGKTKSEVIQMFYDCFAYNNKEDHFMSFWGELVTDESGNIVF